MQEVIRSQFVGIRMARRELAPGMAQKLAQQNVHTIERLGRQLQMDSFDFLFLRIIQCKLREDLQTASFSILFNLFMLRMC